MTVTFESVIDHLCEWLPAHGSPVPVVGSKPDNLDEYARLWLGGGQQPTKITAEVIVNAELWVRRGRADADVRAEHLAEELRALISTRARDLESFPRIYEVRWPGFPADLPPADDETDQWARVVMMAALSIRGTRFAGPVGP